MSNGAPPDVPDVARYRLALLLESAARATAAAVGRNLTPEEYVELVEWIAADWQPVVDAYASTLPQPPTRKVHHAQDRPARTTV